MKLDAVLKYLVVSGRYSVAALDIPVCPEPLIEHLREGRTPVRFRMRGGGWSTPGWIPYAAIHNWTVRPRIQKPPGLELEDLTLGFCETDWPHVKAIPRRVQPQRVTLELEPLQPHLFHVEREEDHLAEFINTRQASRQSQRKGAR